MSYDYSCLTPAGLAHELGNLLEKLDRLQSEADKIPEVEGNIERVRELLKERFDTPKETTEVEGEDPVDPDEGLPTAEDVCGILKAEQSVTVTDTPAQPTQGLEVMGVRNFSSPHVSAEIE